MSSNLRIGLGFDLHALVKGRPCILGGVLFEHDHGPQGHSDADAVLHAVTDAILGAAGLEDLGSLFPDTDERFRGADSGDLLGQALKLVHAEGFQIVNLDVVIATEGPRIAPMRQRMRASIGGLLGIDAGRVNVKGKTLEGMGALAGGTGVAVQALALLEGS